MQVYAQPTDVNQRLCSLMSAVFNRHLRPDFACAVEKKAETLRDHQFEHHQDRRRIGLIFVGNPLLIEAMANSSPKFSRGHDLDIATIPVEWPTRSPLSALANLKKTVQNLQ